MPRREGPHWVEVDALVARLEAAEADRDSWRRVAERCEGEKQAAEADAARLANALEDLLDGRGDTADLRKRAHVALAAHNQRVKGDTDARRT